MLDLYDITEADPDGGATGERPSKFYGLFSSRLYQNASKYGS